MRVSIIVPVYQVAPYIETCLRSVMRQKYKGEVECLLVDDYGSDESMAIVERLLTEYKGSIRFKVFHHKRNRGLSAARNTGVDGATGDYVYFLDSDDTITDDCIERLMGVVQANPDAELVQGNVLTMPAKNLEGLTISVRQTIAITNSEVRRCFFELRQLNVAVWNKLVKRSFLIENDVRFEEGVIFEDTPWMFQLLKHLERAYFVEAVTYHYKRRANSIITGSDDHEKAESLLRNYHQILTNLTPGNERVELGYYGKWMAYFCARYAKVMPEYKEEIKTWQKRAKQYGIGNLSVRLTLGRMMSGIHHGWLLLSLLYRMEHPRLIPSDVQRILMRLRKTKI